MLLSFVGNKAVIPLIWHDQICCPASYLKSIGQKSCAYTCAHLGQDRLTKGKDVSVVQIISFLRAPCQQKKLPPQRQLHIEEFILNQSTTSRLMIFSRSSSVTAPSPSALAPCSEPNSILSIRKSTTASRSAVVTLLSLLASPRT